MKGKMLVIGLLAVLFVCAGCADTPAGQAVRDALGTAIPPLILPAETSEAEGTSVPSGSGPATVIEPTVTAAPAESIESVSVEIADGCWLEVDTSTDRRLWGLGQNSNGDQYFNTTYSKPDGMVVKETLTLQQILAINPNWRSWSQRCIGDLTPISGPTATLALPMPTPTKALVPTAMPLATNPPAELVAQIQNDTAFVLAAAEKIRQYVGASGGDKDVCAAAEPALRFILDAKTEGLLAALPVKSGVWGESSVASWTRWSSDLRSRAESALGLTETAFGVWFGRNFAGAEFGAEIVLPKGVKTFGATYKGVRGTGGTVCAFGSGILNDHEVEIGETMQIEIRRRFDVVLANCDDEKATVVMIAAESAAEQLFDQGILDAVLAGPARGHPSVADAMKLKDVVFRTGRARLLRPEDPVLIEEPDRKVIFQETEGSKIVFKINGVFWEVPDGSVTRLTYRREVGECLYCEQYRAVQTPDSFMVYLFPLGPGWYDGQPVHRVP